MKSRLPFWGVRNPEVRKIVRGLNRSIRLDTSREWLMLVESIWQQSRRREERYSSVEIYVDPLFKAWVQPETVDIVEKIVVEGAWWDIIDPIAINGTSRMLKNQPESTQSILKAWATSGNIWKRRTAILSQLHHKGHTDWELQKELMEPSVATGEFFLQKAVGWALRQYSRTDPDAVVTYIQDNSDRLSALSIREGLKLIRKGQN